MELRKRTAGPKTTAVAGDGEEDDGPVEDDDFSLSEASLFDSDSSPEEENNPAKFPPTSKRKAPWKSGSGSAASAGRRFNCPECPKSFIQEAHLLLHTQKHTGERRFVCKFPGCDFRAAVKSVMTSHERLHTGEKPFKCSFAGCAFAAKQWAPLKMHERRHTGEKPYVCGINDCVYRGIQRTALLNHIASNHPKNALKDAVGFQESVVDPSKPRVDLLAGQVVSLKRGTQAGKKRAQPMAPPAETPAPCPSVESSPKETETAKERPRSGPAKPWSKREQELSKEQIDALMANLRLASVQGQRNFLDLYPCPVDKCKFTCRITEVMRDHLQNHGFNYQPHLCGIDECSRRARSRPELEAHLRKEHPGKGLSDTKMRRHRFPCTTAGCKASFRNSTARNVHIVEHHGPTMHVCGIDGCGDILKTLECLRSHVERRHPGRSMAETLRGRLGESVSEFTAEELVEKFGLKKVLYCPFFSRHTTKTGFTSICPFTCTDKDRMDEHMKMVHGGDKPYVCGINACLFRCKNASSLRTHVLALHPHADYEKDAVKREFLNTVVQKEDKSSERNVVENKSDRTSDAASISESSEDSSENYSETDEQRQEHVLLLGNHTLLVNAVENQPNLQDEKTTMETDTFHDMENDQADYEMTDVEAATIKEESDESLELDEHPHSSLLGACRSMQVDSSRQLMSSDLEPENATSSTQVYMVGLNDKGSTGRFQTKVTGITPCSMPMSKGGTQQFGFFVSVEDFEGLRNLLPSNLVSPFLLQNSVSF